MMPVDMIYRLIKDSLLIVLSILVLISAPGCTKPDTSSKGIEFYEEDTGEGYITMTVITDNYSFSFEYSTFYERREPRNTRPEYTLTHTYTFLTAPKAKVDLVLPSGSNKVRTRTVTFIPASIVIDIYDPTLDGRIESYNSTERMNKHLVGEADFDNFRLIERSLITVSGIEAEYAEWEVGWFNLFPKTSGEPPLEYRWSIYFDHKDMIWWIRGLSSGPEYKDRIKADLDHIVKTFKILD